MTSRGAITAEYVAEMALSIQWRDTETQARRVARYSAETIAELVEALEQIIDIGKRDLTNPKYDGYFETAQAVLNKAKGRG